MRPREPDALSIIIDTIDNYYIQYRMILNGHQIGQHCSLSCHDFALFLNMIKRGAMDYGVIMYVYKQGALMNVETLVDDILRKSVFKRPVFVPDKKGETKFS